MSEPITSPNDPREYDPDDDPNFGRRIHGEITWSSEWLRVYMERIHRQWPAHMAKAAADRATGRK